MANVRDPGQAQAVEIVIIDADDLARRGLADLVREDHRFTLGSEAALPSDAARLARAGLVIFDPLSRDRLDPSWFTEVRARAPSAAVVVLTSRFDETAFVRALEVGSSGYLIKGRILGAALLDAAYLIATSSCFAADIAARDYLAASPAALRPPAEPAYGHPTERELEMLRLIAEGLHDEEIAERLGIQSSTVESHVSRMREKLGAAHRGHLVALAYRYRLL